MADHRHLGYLGGGVKMHEFSAQVYQLIDSPTGSITSFLSLLSISFKCSLQQCSWYQMVSLLEQDEANTFLPLFQLSHKDLYHRAIQEVVLLFLV